MVQSDIENQVYQVHRMLADKLDSCKERGNTYMDRNIKKIQELYKEEEKEQKKMEKKKYRTKRKYSYTNYIRNQQDLKH